MKLGIFKIMLSMIYFVQAKSDSSTGDKSSTKEGSSYPSAEDGSTVIVNKEGLDDEIQDNSRMELQEIQSPKGLPPMTLADVHALAKKYHLEPVASFEMFSTPEFIHDAPESVFQVSENQLERATRTNQQQVSFGFGSNTKAKTENEKDAEADNKETETTTDNKDKEVENESDETK